MASSSSRFLAGSKPAAAQSEQRVTRTAWFSADATEPTLKPSATRSSGAFRAVTIRRAARHRFRWMPSASWRSSRGSGSRGLSPRKNSRRRSGSCSAPDSGHCADHSGASWSVSAKSTPLSWPPVPAETDARMAEARQDSATKPRPTRPNGNRSSCRPTNRQN